MNRLEAITEIRRVAREHGYAITVHGTLKRDVDLVAVPWIEAAGPAWKLVVAVAEVLNIIVTRDWVRETVSKRAHGRRGWALRSGMTEPKDHDWYVDLSVMPRRK